MAKYLGFTEGQMINGLMLCSKVFKLEKIEGASGNSELPGFRLYALSDEFGEFECEGALLYVLGKASDPWRDTWVERQKEFQKRLSDFWDSIEKRDIGQVLDR